MNEYPTHSENDPEVLPPQSDTPDDAEERQTLRIPPRKKPIVTWVLLAVTVLVYLAQVLTKNQWGYDIPLYLGAKYGPNIKELHQWWRLITPIFLHGSITHLLFNMYALFVIGPELETVYGKLDFLLFYLITGFTGNVVSYVASPETVSVGASTSLFGMIAAQGFLLYKNKKMIRNYPRAISNILYVVVINLFLGLRSNIDNWGHLGGLVGGILIAFLSGPVIGVRINEDRTRVELYDTVSKKNRYTAFGITTLFFIALAIAG